MDCSPSDSSVHGISQARILEWVAISYSRGSSRPRDQTWQILYHWTTWEASINMCRYSVNAVLTWNASEAQTQPNPSLWKDVTLNIKEIEMEGIEIINSKRFLEPLAMYSIMDIIHLVNTSIVLLSGKGTHIWILLSGFSVFDPVLM